MNDKSTSHGGAPPPDPDGDKDQGFGARVNIVSLRGEGEKHHGLVVAKDAVAPCGKDEKWPLSSPSLPRAYASDHGSITTNQEKPATSNWTRKKRLCLLGAVAILVLGATAVGPGVGVHQARKRSVDLQPPSPGSGAPPMVALAEGFGRNMVADNFVPSSWEFTNWLWHLAPDGTLAWKEFTNGTQLEWVTHNPTRFLTTPSVEQRFQWLERPSPVQAFAIEASTGAMLYTFHESGSWEADNAWQSLGGRFAYPPIVPPWEGVLGVTHDGQLWSRKRSWADGPVWEGDWNNVGDGFAGGLSFSEHWPQMRVAALKDGTYQVMEFDHRDGDFPNDWRDLSRPTSCNGALGSPNLFWWSGEVSVLLVSCAGGLWQKAFRGATWDAEWARFEVDDGGADKLVHDTHGQQLVRAYSRPQYLVSRTTDHCYYGTSFGPDPDDPSDYEKDKWGAWTPLWCQSEEQRNLATAVACDQYADRCDMYREDVDGHVLHAFRDAPDQTELTWELLEGRVGQ